MVFEGHQCHHRSKTRLCLPDICKDRTQVFVHLTSLYLILFSQMITPICEHTYAIFTFT
jgi:hypothetical protein